MSEDSSSSLDYSIENKIDNEKEKFNFKNSSLNVISPHGGWKLITKESYSKSFYDKIEEFKLDS